MCWAELDPTRPPRHARAWFEPHATLHGVVDPFAREALAGWVAKGRAAVVRRRDAHAGTRCCLAIALPIAAGRTRIAFAVDRDDIVRVAAPPTLHEALPSAFPAHREPLGELAAAGDEIGTRFHVYGSLAWQYAAGEPYMTPASDVDLLWRFGDAGHARRVLDLLVRWERETGLRLDGEALLDDGGAVAWRELLASPPRVLVKRLDGVGIEPSPMRDARMAA